MAAIQDSMGRTIYDVPRLREIREARGYSKSGLARASGMSRTTIYMLEDELRHAQPRTIQKLAEVLGTTTSVLTDGALTGGHGNMERVAVSDATVESLGRAMARLVASVSDTPEETYQVALKSLNDIDLAGALRGEMPEEGDLGITLGIPSDDLEGEYYFRGEEEVSREASRDASGTVPA